MILVDTSILIDFFRKENNPPVRKFYELLEKSIPYGISEMIYMEVLQGSNNKETWKTLEQFLKRLPIVSSERGLDFYHDSAEIYFKCRKMGISPRSMVDCLIVQLAIDFDLYLLHNDRDFLSIQKVMPKLKML